MRIIAGMFKGKKIHSVEGNTARPTTDFVREMIFSTLYSLNTKNTNVLDLYAGSGSLGIEALSRGAENIVFVEGARKAVSAILANLKALNCADKCKVIMKKVDTFLKNCDEMSFDIIFCDPPYNKGLVNSTIDSIAQKDILNDDGILIVEHSKDEPIHETQTIHKIKEKHTSNTTITFINFRR